MCVCWLLQVPLRETLNVKTHGTVFPIVAGMHVSRGACASGWTESDSGG